MSKFSRRLKRFAKYGCWVEIEGLFEHLPAPTQFPNKEGIIFSEYEIFEDYSRMINQHWFVLQNLWRAESTYIRLWPDAMTPYEFLRNGLFDTKGQNMPFDRSLFGSFEEITNYFYGLEYFDTPAGRATFIPQSDIGNLQKLMKSHILLCKRWDDLCVCHADRKRRKRILDLLREKRDIVLGDCNNSEGE